MNATQDIATKSPSCPAPVEDAAAATQQREKNKRSFQAKYDAMLYIVEFIATFHLLDRRNPKQAKKMEDLKSLVVKTRNGLGISATGSLNKLT